eukprot:2583608-Amphidinium_carterae.1
MPSAGRRMRWGGDDLNKLALGRKLSSKSNGAALCKVAKRQLPIALDFHGLETCPAFKATRNTDA